MYTRARLAACLFSVAVFATSCSSADKPAEAGTAPKEASVSLEMPSEVPVVVAEAPAKTPPKPAPPVERKVIREWDFATLPKDTVDWYFPGGTPQQNARGFWYVTADRQSGPQLEMAKLKAADVDAVHVEGYATGTDRGLAPQEHPVEAIHLYWARPGDFSGDEYPFVDARRVTLRKSEKSGLWGASLSQHKEWTGDIAKLYLRYDLAPRPGGSFSVFTKRIALLK